MFNKDVLLNTNLNNLDLTNKRKLLANLGFRVVTKDGRYETYDTWAIRNRDFIGGVKNKQFISQLKEMSGKMPTHPEIRRIQRMLKNSVNIMSGGGLAELQQILQEIQKYIDQNNVAISELDEYEEDKKKAFERENERLNLIKLKVDNELNYVEQLITENTEKDAELLRLKQTIQAYCEEYKQGQERVKQYEEGKCSIKDLCTEISTGPEGELDEEEKIDILPKPNKQLLKQMAGDISTIAKNRFISRKLRRIYSSYVSDLNKSELDLDPVEKKEMYKKMQDLEDLEIQLAHSLKEQEKKLRQRGGSNFINNLLQDLTKKTDSIKILKKIDDKVNTIKQMIDKLEYQSFI